MPTMAKTITKKSRKPETESTETANSHDSRSNEKEQFHCLNCGCSNSDKFYKSYKPFNKYSHKIPYCKDCIRGEMWDFYLRKYSYNEQLALHGLLRSLDLPYIHSIYLASVKNISNPDSTIQAGELNEDGKREKHEALISAYFKHYNSFHDRNGYGDTYLDSEGLSDIQGVSVYEDTINLKRKRKPQDINNIDTDKYEVIEYDAEELLNKWGEFEDIKLIKLETEYLDWADKLGDYMNDKSVDLVVRQVCHQTVDIQEKRERGEKVKDDVTALQSLLSQSGLIEKTREKNTETIKLGMTIKEIEDFDPIDFPRKELVDIDKYGDIIDCFTGAMCRTLGKQNIFTRRFDEKYKNYSIDFDAINNSLTQEEPNG